MGRAGFAVGLQIKIFQKILNINAAASFPKRALASNPVPSCPILLEKHTIVHNRVVGIIKYRFNLLIGKIENLLRMVGFAYNISYRIVVIIQVLQSILPVVAGGSQNIQPETSIVIKTSRFFQSLIR